VHYKKRKNNNPENDKYQNVNLLHKTFWTEYILGQKLVHLFVFNSNKIEQNTYQATRMAPSNFCESY